MADDKAATSNAGALTNERVLQDYVPCTEAVRWDIQAEYFSRKCQDAWLNKEVPNVITSNSFAALNNASVVLEAVSRQTEMGSLGPNDPVVVLEYGAGLGLFAYNFIRRFEQVCKREGKDYAQRLIYIASDYRPEVAQALCKAEFLQSFIANNQLKVAVADAMSSDPASFYQADSTNKNVFIVTQDELPKLSAVITNYLHCCLPSDHLQQTGDRWFNKLVKTSITLTEDEVTNQVSQEQLFNSEDILSRLQEVPHWQPVSLTDFCMDDAHLAALQTVVADRPESNLLNPVGSLKTVKAAAKNLLDGGVYLLHDKGYNSTSAYNIDATSGHSIHGGCTAFMVNFPVIEAYANELGFRSYLTKSYQYLIQTLLLEKTTTPSHKQVFRYLYGDFNVNSDLVDLHVYGQTLAEAGELKLAAEAIQKCLRYRSLDADLYFIQGNLYLKLDMPQRALHCVQKGRPLDHFQQFNFTMIEAQAHFKLENHTLAFKLFDKALTESQSTEQMKEIEKLLFEAHHEMGLATEDFTPERYPALSCLPADVD